MPTSTDGTPIVAEVSNDIAGFLQKLLLAPGTPDTVQNSQYFDSLIYLIIDINEDKIVKASF